MDKLNLKKIKKSQEEALEILKNGEGVYLQLAVPNVSKKEFESWQLNNKIGGTSVLNANCNSATLAVLLNALEEIEHNLMQGNPEIKLINLISNLKSSLTIEEEDLKDES